MTLKRRLELADILGRYRARIVAQGTDVECELSNLMMAIQLWRMEEVKQTWRKRPMWHTRETVDYEAVRAILDSRT